MNYSGLCGTKTFCARPQTGSCVCVDYDRWELMEATKGYKVELINNSCKWQSGAKRTKHEHVSLHVDYGVRLAKLFYSTPEPTVKARRPIIYRFRLTLTY